MANAPCKDCPDRVVSCHSACTKYLEYREQQDADNEARRKAICEHPMLRKGSWLGDSGLSRSGHKKRRHKRR